MYTDNAKICNLFIKIINLMESNRCNFKEADEIAKLVTSELKAQRSAIEDRLEVEGDLVRYYKCCNADNMFIDRLNQIDLKSEIRSAANDFISEIYSSDKT